MTTTPAKPGVIVTVLYKRTPNLHFNLSYYLSHHFPLAKKLWEPHGMTDGYMVVPKPDSEFAYTVTMHWKDIQAWEEATGDQEEMAELTGDVKNFTNEMPVFVVGNVVS